MVMIDRFPRFNRFRYFQKHAIAQIHRIIQSENGQWRIILTGKMLKNSLTS